MSVGMDLILKIERDFMVLRKEYTLFFNDVNKIEPYELRDSLSADIKRLRNMSNLRTEEQFRATNLIAKCQSHLQLWARQTDRKFNGDPLLAARKKRLLSQDKLAKKEKQATKKKSNVKKVVLDDPNNQRERVVELYDEYMRLNLMLGSRKMANFAKFQSFISNQTTKIKQTKRVEKVAYEVLVQDDKVVIRSRSSK
ncbi:hypothetical protein SCOR_21165 [Sulfidibacter corallicola]|uniref:Uncharacterized protein n=1 Tax=Sulfidibacter corallicola TaxID=2818388 RepID=A0A8A4TVP4_SULCO|nr:hypothetical protein [Sulfidibacter corallicola]QTD53052.1 hypothetical protein J3U87_11375 [Sulfidibacter corallicola]